MPITKSNHLIGCFILFVAFANQYKGKFGFFDIEILTLRLLNNDLNGVNIYVVTYFV